jgi:hypothetical protein
VARRRRDKEGGDGLRERIAIHLKQAGARCDRVAVVHCPVARERREGRSKDEFEMIIS